LKKREIIGISVEKDLLKLATLSVVKDKIRITRVQTIKMNETLIKKGQPTGVTDIESGSESEDSIFGLDDDLGLGGSTDPGTENWDMTEDGVNEEFKGGSNAVQFATIISAIHPTVVNVALTIPKGFTHLQTIEKIDPKKVGKKKFNSDLKGTLHTLYGHDIGDEQFRFQLRKNNSILLTSVDAPIPTLELVDASVPFYKGNVNVREIVSEEVLLMGLARANYDILDHQFTCIVHMDENNTQILFMHGKEFHSILPEISEGSKSTKVNSTVFSKILFEVDRGKIPTLDRIIITGSTNKNTLQEYLTEQFLDVEIGPLQYSGDRLEVLETVVSEYKNYTMAIAAAWSALDTNKELFLPISFVPKYVLNRQQVFKLNWHGYLLLALIAITPAVLNNYYNHKADQIQDNKYRITQINQQIDQVRVIANEVDRLTAEFLIYNQQVSVLDTLSYNTLKWSRTLGLINSSAQAIDGYWIRSIQSSGENLVLQGTALYRDRIPKLSNEFDTAIIQQVTEREYRGITVYDFTLLVTRIVNDYRMFKPQQPQLPQELLKIQEVSAAGTIENQ
jgi:hypothetical protein